MSDHHPGHRLHPFWSAPVGSRLTLEMKVPPECQLKCLELLVHTVSTSTPIQVISRYFSGQEDCIYCSVSDARHIVRNEWMVHYRDRTKVIFQPATAVDMEALVTSTTIAAPKTPRRRNSLYRTRSTETDSEDSPRSSPQTPRRPAFDVSPRTRSADGSPRGWWKKRLSLPLNHQPDTLDSLDAPGLKSPHSPHSPHSPRSPRSPRSGGSRESSPRWRFLRISSPRSTPSSPKSGRAPCKSPVFEELMEKTRGRWAHTAPKDVDE